MSERNGANLAVFQRNGIAGVAFSADAVEAQQFTCHLKPL
jgi:hypothetical protein